MIKVIKIWEEYTRALTIKLFNFLYDFPNEPNCFKNCWSTLNFEISRPDGRTDWGAGVDYVTPTKHRAEDNQNLDQIWIRRFFFYFKWDNSTQKFKWNTSKLLYVSVRPLTMRQAYNVYSAIKSSNPNEKIEYKNNLWKTNRQEQTTTRFKR